MVENCKCPLCGTEAIQINYTKCTLFKCNKCGEFELNIFENEAQLTDIEKSILSTYLSNATRDDYLRRTIITKDNYDEIIQRCKNFKQ